MNPTKIWCYNYRIDTRIKSCPGLDPIGIKNSTSDRNLASWLMDSVCEKARQMIEQRSEYGGYGLKLLSNEKTWRPGTPWRTEQTDCVAKDKTRYRKWYSLRMRLGLRPVSVECHVCASCACFETKPWPIKSQQYFKRIHKSIQVEQDQVVHACLRIMFAICSCCKPLISFKRMCNTLLMYCNIAWAVSYRKLNLGNIN